MIIIGEKINGSIPKTGAAIAAKDEEYIRMLARKQTEYGATYIDCCASVNEGELDVQEWLIGLIMEESDLPIAIDSPDPQVCVDASNSEVHHRHLPRGGVGLLPEDGKVVYLALMAAHEVRRLHEHAATTAGYVR